MTPEKNSTLEKELAEKQNALKKTKLEIEYEEAKLADIEARKGVLPGTSSSIDLEYHSVQIDNGRDRVKQLQRQLQEREAAVKLISSELSFLNDELDKERKTARETTDKVKRLQESYEELKRLKTQVLESKERGLTAGQKSDLRTLAGTSG